MLIMAALVGVLLLVVIALCYRLWKLRQVGGTAAILRDFPAVGGQGWRHGVMRYRGGEAGFYRLSSLRWWPDRRLSRRGLEIVSRRSPRGDEFDIMTDAIVILELRDTSPERGRGYEVALDRGALTAFQSWLESRPSSRARRRTIDRKRPTSNGLRASAHPPGCQSTSPSGLATLVRMNSRSESRLRYLAGNTLTPSGCASTASHAERSARRATVRAT